MVRRISQAHSMKGTVACLKITLEDSEPPIWRRIEVKATTTLKTLHPIIQAAMGWEHDHLFHYKIGGYSADGGRVSLADLAEAGYERFCYLYDMGDSWEHELRIEKLWPADPGALYPRYIDGAGRCPPEGGGSVPGLLFDEKAIDEDQIRKDLTKIAKRGQRNPPQ